LTEGNLLIVNCDPSYLLIIDRLAVNLHHNLKNDTQWCPSYD
jgi:hypothetical protein